MSTETVALLEDAFVDTIAKEIAVRAQQVRAADALFAQDATVPFVARYRKEATGGLSDAELEHVHKRRAYFLELAERRQAILESIAEQGKLSAEIEAALRAALTKHEIEDLYLPFKPKRRTRAQLAVERGLEPLADLLIERAGGDAVAEELASAFVSAEKGVADVEAALSGARDILAERLADAAEHRAALRAALGSEARLKVQVIAGQEEKGAVYRDYFDHSEPLARAPSHRLLAILRGEREGHLATTLEIDDARQIERLKTSWKVPLETSCGRQAAEAAEDGFKRLLRPSIAAEVRAAARERAEAEAIAVFRANLEALLLQSPLGQVPVLGLDPGYRTGCKAAVIDVTGKVVATATIFPTPPNARPDDAALAIVRFVKDHGVLAIAIGNGTASRETEIFVRRLFKDIDEVAGNPADSVLKKIVVAIVPETGASVYSASALARTELPELDVSLRGAVSIARRMQDPLAELVKIEPRSLGVGQYQHDVDQKSLDRELDLAVEGVVNRVGVELNTASIALLRRVAGLSERLAKGVVAFRDANGGFTSRRQLLEVAGIGPKTFEQAAGFLRIRGNEPTLDATAVHPERYPVVEAMARELGVGVGDLIGNPALVSRLQLERFIDVENGVGEFTLADIRGELEKPGRDPRPEFRAPSWRDDVLGIEDLKPEMVLEGRVSNVTNFGAFVDIGVKRDGLVHLSELSHQWVKDPRVLVQVGQIVKVKVVEVDTQRGRITLSIKALQPAPRRERAERPAAAAEGGRKTRGGESKPRPERDRGKDRGPKRAAAGQAAREAPARRQSDLKDDLNELLNKFKRRW
jgi:uncharacterized protein